MNIQKNKNFSIFFVFFALFFAFFCFFAIFTTHVTFAESGTSEYICTANFCYLYSSPSFTSTKIYDGENLVKANHKDIVYIETDNGVVVSETDANGMTFLKVASFDGNTYTSAYIFSDYVTENISNIETYPTYNATTLSETYLYLASGEDILVTDTVIAKGTRLYLYEGYDKTLSYTKVAYKNGNTLTYGYVLTECISPDGVNPAIIYAITIVLACIGIVMALVFMKNKKTTKK